MWVWEGVILLGNNTKIVLWIYENTLTSNEQPTWNDSHSMLYDKHCESGNGYDINYRQNIQRNYEKVNAFSMTRVTTWTMGNCE